MQMGLRDRQSVGFFDEVTAGALLVFGSASRGFAVE
jgi:hypothetical protein